MNSLLIPPYPELLIFDVTEQVASFEETVKDLSPELEKRYQELLPIMMPYLENYLYTESQVGAWVFNMWDAYSEVSSTDMEIYTDAVMCLADSIASYIYQMGYYNHKGECIYLFDNCLLYTSPSPRDS